MVPIPYPNSTQDGKEKYSSWPEMHAVTNIFKVPLRFLRLFHISFQPQLKQCPFQEF